MLVLFFFFSSRRRHTRYCRDWSSDVCSSDLYAAEIALPAVAAAYGLITLATCGRCDTCANIDSIRARTAGAVTEPELTLKKITSRAPRLRREAALQQVGCALGAGVGKREIVRVAGARALGQRVDSDQQDQPADHHVLAVGRRPAGELQHCGLQGVGGTGAATSRGAARDSSEKLSTPIPRIRRARPQLTVGSRGMRASSA